MPAIAPHSTATTDAAWDGPAAKANLKLDANEAYYRSAFAWQDPDGDPKTKAAYKFIHHTVSGSGEVGAANLTACSTGIGVLNGGRGGTVIPDGDRKGVWNHLARHLRDADKEPPPLSSYEEYLESLARTNDSEEQEEEAPLTFQLLAMHDRPWAITPHAFQSLLQASRHPEILEAVAARVGKPLDNGNGGAVENHNGTAVMDIRGPLFRYRSIFTWLLGGSSVDQISLGLHAAVDDPGVQRIVLAINSPGGQIDGINELANMIRAADRVKPVTAYVDGLAGSGAYWLASAAGRIVADETAQLGSIGVLATVMDDRAAEERRGIKRYDIISSQSPLKRTDPGTDEGRAQIQEMVDGMAQVFIDKVAQFRGVTSAQVANNFGRGAVMPAQQAITAGMADALGSLEDLLRKGNGPVRDIKDNPRLRVKAAAPFDEAELEEEDTEVNDDANCTCPAGDGEDCQCEDNEAGEQEGTEQEPDNSSIPRHGGGDLIKPTAERQRIAAILTCEEARGREELARVLALETDHTVDAAQKILKASPAGGKPTTVNALEAHMAQLPNPKVGVPGDAGEDDSPAAEVQRILAFVPNDRKHPRVRVQ